METDSDIYENIPNIPDNNELYEEIEKLRQQNDLLQELINSLEGDVEKLCAKITEMKKIQDNLSKNISELFKTAKAELERKDRTIAELRSQLETFHQRKRTNFSMKRERDKSPSVDKLPLEHVAKKMREDDEIRMKRSHFRRSRSRSRSSEEGRRHYRDRRERFDRYKYEHDGRRIMRDDKYVERGHRNKNYSDSRDHDRREISRKEITELKYGAEIERRNSIEKKNTEESEMLKRRRELDKREVVVVLGETKTTTKLKNNFENESKGVDNNVVKRNRNVEDAKISKNTDKKEIVISFVKETGDVNVDSVDRVEKEKEKKKTVIDSSLEMGIKNNVESEDKSDKVVEKNETAVQRNVNEKMNMKNDDKMVEPMNKKSNVNEVNKKQQALNQKKIQVNRDIKGLIVKNSAAVKTQNKKCTHNEESSLPIDLEANMNEEEEKSSTNENKSLPALINQNDEDLTTKKDTNTKMNKTRIEEVAKKLYERLEEDAKQDPQKATPLSLQLVDSTETVNKAEVKKAKIEEVTRQLFGNSEDEDSDEMEETSPAGLETVDVANNSNKSEAKNVCGVRIEAVSKKLFGKLQEAKQDSKKTSESLSLVGFKEVDHKNKEEIEDGRMKEKPVDKEQANCASSTVTSTKELAHKNEDTSKEVTIKVSDGETKPVLQKPTGRSVKSDNVREVKEKSRDEIIKRRVEEVSKKLFGEEEEAVKEENKKSTFFSTAVTSNEETRINNGKDVTKSKINVGAEEENKKSTSINLTVTSGEETKNNNNGKNVIKSKINVTQNSGRLEEETKQVLQKTTAKCLKLDYFSEVDDKSEEENEMKIAEMSKMLFKAITEEPEDEKQKAVSATEAHATEIVNKSEEKINGSKSEEVDKKSQSEYMDVNLTESIKNSVDFTKKRHDMMYGEVSKEISMFLPQCGNINKENKQNIDELPKKKEKKEDIKGKVNDRHKEKKKTNTPKNESGQKSNKEQKSHKVDKGKKKDDVRVKNESSKMNKLDEKKGTPPDVLNDQKTSKEKNSVTTIGNECNGSIYKEQNSKHQKECDILMKDETTRYNEEKNSEVPPKNQEIEAEKSDVPKKSSLKSNKKEQNFKEQREGSDKCGIPMKDEFFKHNKEKKSGVSPKDQKVEAEKSSLKRSINKEQNFKDQKEPGNKSDIPMKDEFFKRDKEKNSDISPKDQKVEAERSETPKELSLKSINKEQNITDQKEGGDKCDIPMMGESSKHNKDKKTEVPPKDQKLEAEKSGTPKKSSLKRSINKEQNIRDQKEDGNKSDVPMKDELFKRNKEKSSEISPKDQKVQTEKSETPKKSSLKRSINKEQHSKDQKEGSNKVDLKMNDESSKYNKEKNSEVPPKNQKIEAEKPETPKKSTTDTKPKKTKENTKKDPKNKDDDSSGSIVEESDRVLRSATRRSSRLQEETQKKSINDITNQKNKKSDAKLDLNPRIESSEVIAMNLSHDGEIPVLHISEDSHLFKNSTVFNLENCPPVVTSSPIKSDSSASFNLSGLNGSNSLSETRIFNTSSGRKRRRVVLTMVD